MTSDGTTPRLRLLVVDDDDVDRLALLRALGAAGLGGDVVECTSADEALARLDGTVDCVLSDLHMPGRDGRWFLRAARERADVPIIMLTGLGDEQTAVEIMKAGAADYIPKNQIGPERITVAVRHAVQVARVQRENARVMAALTESEQRLRTALDATAIGTFDYRPPHVTWDARALQIFGVPPGGTLDDDNFDELIHPDDRERVQATMARAYDPVRGGDFDFEYRAIGRDGVERVVRATGRPFFEDGRLVRAVGVVQDLTTRKHLETQARHQSELQQHLLGVVSHDLRSPLSAIMLSATSLLQRGEASSSGQRALTRIVSSAERATRLINDLLDFTQARSAGGLPVSLRESDLHDVARLVVDEARAAHPDRDVELEVDADVSGVCDPDRVAQALTNLVANAIVYSAADSTVRVRVRGGDAIAIEVHNDGEPIPEELRVRLFSPFERGDNRSKKGLGLGLFIVKEIVRAHGGGVDVASSPAEGTVFRVTLPRRPTPG